MSTVWFENKLFRIYKTGSVFMPYKLREEDKWKRAGDLEEISLKRNFKREELLFGDYKGHPFVFKEVAPLHLQRVF